MKGEQLEFNFKSLPDCIEEINAAQVFYTSYIETLQGMNPFFKRLQGALPGLPDVSRGFDSWRTSRRNHR